MKAFVILTLIIGTISQCIHPEMQTWVTVSTVTYIICGLLGIAIAFYYRKDRKKMRKAITGIVVVYTEYAVISAIAYFRMIDTILEEGPLSIALNIAVFIVFTIIVFWDDVKERLFIK